MRIHADPDPKHCLKVIIEQALPAPAAVHADAGGLLADPQNTQGSQRNQSQSSNPELK